MSQSTYLGTNSSSAGTVVTPHSDGSSSTEGAGADISFTGGWDFGTGGTDLSHTWVSFDGQTRPMLSMEYSTTITNAHQLQLIGLNATTLAANYTVANDIDLSGTTNQGDIWGTAAGGIGGFVALGSTNSLNYSGTFNGQGHILSNLYINQPSLAGAGLIVGIASGATVENVGLTNATVTAAQNMGLLVGFNNGTISNAYSTGTLSNPGNGLGLGGLVGDNGGTINNCYSNATVNAGGNTSEIGGLVGYNFSGID